MQTKDFIYDSKHRQQNDRHMNELVKELSDIIICPIQMSNKRP